MALLMKLKNIGKTIMRKINLILKRKEILEISKKYIVRDGWNEDLFESVSKNSKFKINEIKILFPEGYLSLLKFYLKELDTHMVLNAKNINLIRMKTHIRIREIILLKLKKDTSQYILASFPKPGGILGWQRKIRYKIRNCQLYYYSEEMLKNLMLK